MTNAAEAIGVVRAAAAAEIPSAVSFTVGTDGRLPTGQPLHEVIEQVDAENDAALYATCPNDSTVWVIAL